MYLRWFLVILLFSHPVCSVQSVHAATQTFTATHTYVLGDDDSRNSARQKCLAEAKRKILEQVGVYLESHSELLTSAQSGATGGTKSSQTTNEEQQQMTERITTLTAGIMKTEVVKEEFGDVNGRLHMTLAVKADVDPDDIQRQLAAKRADQGVRKQVKEQEQRIEKLQTQLRAMMQGMRSLGEIERGGSKQSTKSTVDPNVAIIRELARQGEAYAQAYLEMMYVIGKDVPRSDNEAVIWFRKAAAQGNGNGQAGLGWMYAMGRGVPQSDTEAVTWSLKAAEQGNAWGQFALGVMYVVGNGVPESETEGAAWMRKAAEEGNAGWGPTGSDKLYLWSKGKP
ncbi:MAG: tetratricopeptide repeat protein [Nitrospirota bacterium]